MISVADILLLHEFSIRDFGGAYGLRDEQALLSAIARPFQTFDGAELYPTPYAKAAALVESTIINHPFVDGNKRVGLLAMLAILKEYNIELDVDDDELYDYIIAITTGAARFEDIVVWLEKHSLQP